MPMPDPPTLEPPSSPPAQPVLGPAAAGDLEAREPSGARALIWRLEFGGWSEREAGNLVALLRGLRPALTGWREREIDHLCFLRALVDSGRLEH